MKKFFLTFFSIIIFNVVEAQGDDVNTFQKSEDRVTGANRPVDAEAQDEGPGNPPGDEDVPIDNYIPVLIIAGISLVIYQYKKRQKAIQ